MSVAGLLKWSLISRQHLQTILANNFQEAERLLSEMSQGQDTLSRASEQHSSVLTPVHACAHLSQPAAGPGVQLTAETGLLCHLLPTTHQQMASVTCSSPDT